MLIQCDQCQKRYHIEFFQEGRRVRCTGCGHTWFQNPEPDEILREQQIFEEEPMIIHKKKPKRRWLKRFIICFILTGLSSLGYHLFPLFSEAQLIYNKILGLSLQPQKVSIDIRNTKIETMSQGVGGKTSLKRWVISGDIINSSAYLVPLPPLKIKLFKRSSESTVEKLLLVHKFTHSLSQKKILPGEILHFETSFEPTGSTPDAFIVEF